MIYIPNDVSDDEIDMMIRQGPNEIGPGPYALAVALRKARSTNPAGPVAGYTAQSPEKVALVNSFKEDEERLLRKIDALIGDVAKETQRAVDTNEQVRVPYDPRWIAIARTHFNEGFMALARAVFQPQRIKLPEDGE